MYHHFLNSLRDGSGQIRGSDAERERETECEVQQGKVITGEPSGSFTGRRAHEAIEGRRREEARIQEPTDGTGNQRNYSSQTYRRC